MTTPIRIPAVSESADTNPLCPVITSSRSAASATVCAIGPGESCDPLIGTICSRGTDPTVGLMPTQPFTDAGQMIEPSVSEPTAICTKSAATAAPDPDDDPPALCL